MPALPGSGALAIKDSQGNSRSIEYAIEGFVGGADYSLSYASTEAGKDPLPTAITDFYGYQHYGSMFSEYTGTPTGVTPYIQRVNHGGSYLMNASQTEEYECDAINTGEDTYCDDNGSAFKVIDSVDAELYYTTKGGVSGWSLAQSWTNYVSQSYTSHDFDTYSYKWKLAF